MEATIVETYVITGGTRGIGFGIARELLKRGQNVFLCGRSEKSVKVAVTKLEAEQEAKGRVGGIPCDISSYIDVQKLWEAAIAKFQNVHVWVNNAAISPHVSLLSVDSNDEEQQHMQEISQCIDINIKGAIHCCRVAAKGMKKQPPCQRKFRIYLTEGLGSDGSIRSSSTMVYGMTKYAGTYLANAMEKEVPDNISVGRLQPGMVTTDLLMSSLADKTPEEIASTKKIFNILADKEETVTPYLADQLVLGNISIRWLTPASVFGRFLKSLFVSRDLFEEE